MAGAGDRARWAGEQDLAAAHATAQFTRAKKLEPLKHYLARWSAKRPKKGEGGSMLDRMKSIVKATGGKVIE